MNPNFHQRKVVVIGDQSVGKTCILQRLIDHTFDPNSPPTISNSTSQYTCTLSNGQSVTLTIWDTAGQEKYRSLTSVYFRDSQAAVIVFDVMNPNPAPEIKSWIQSYKQVVGDSGYIIVVGNKSDLLINPAETQGHIQEMEIELGVNITLVSALSGDGIESLFEHVAEKVSEMVHEVPAVEFQPAQKKGCC